MKALYITDKQSFKLFGCIFCYPLYIVYCRSYSVSFKDKIMNIFKYNKKGQPEKSRDSLKDAV